MFSHIQNDRARMVDISDKREVARRAVASGEIQLQPKTIEAVKNRQIVKGEVLETAQLVEAGAKRAATIGDLPVGLVEDA